MFDIQNERFIAISMSGGCGTIPKKFHWVSVCMFFVWISSEFGRCSQFVCYLNTSFLSCSHTHTYKTYADTVLRASMAILVRKRNKEQANEHLRSQFLEYINNPPNIEIEWEWKTKKKVSAILLRCRYLFLWVAFLFKAFQNWILNFMLIYWNEYFIRLTFRWR